MKGELKEFARRLKDVVLECKNLMKGELKEKSSAS